MLKLLQIVFLLSLLSACSNSWRNVNSYPASGETIGGAVIGAASGAVVTSGNPAGIIIGGATGGFIGHILEKHETLLHQLANNHVQVIAVGDNLTLVLPSDRFFVSNTPLLNGNYYSVLDQIAVLLSNFNKYSVKVSAYTDNMGWPERNLALSRQQALNMADYLWKHGIDARLLSAEGEGGQMPIANNNTTQGRALNRRVEITLRLITDE